MAGTHLDRAFVRETTIETLEITDGNGSDFEIFVSTEGIGVADSFSLLELFGAGHDGFHFEDWLEAKLAIETVMIIETIETESQPDHIGVDIAGEGGGISGGGVEVLHGRVILADLLHEAVPETDLALGERTISISGIGKVGSQTLEYQTVVAAYDSQGFIEFLGQETLATHTSVNLEMQADPTGARQITTLDGTTTVQVEGFRARRLSLGQAAQSVEIGDGERNILEPSGGNSLGTGVADDEERSVEVSGAQSHGFEVGINDKEGNMIVKLENSGYLREAMAVGITLQDGSDGSTRRQTAETFQIAEQSASGNLYRDERFVGEAAPGEPGQESHACIMAHNQI